MSDSFYKNTLTRRNLVQIAYQNEFKNQDEDYYLSQGYEFKAKVNEQLYRNLLKQLLIFWNNYEKFFLENNIDLKGISLISISVIKVAIAEFELKLLDKKLIISEYLKIANSFLEEHEIKVVNKILDNCLVI